MKSVDTAPRLERLLEPGFQKLSKLSCMRSTPTEMQSMNENDFECLAKTRLNTPPMAKMTDDELRGSYAGLHGWDSQVSRCGTYDFERAGTTMMSFNSYSNQERRLSVEVLLLSICCFFTLSQNRWRR